MKVSGKINVWRGKIMRGMMKYIGRNYRMPKPDPNMQIKKILISRPNSRLGNQLLIMPIVQEISAIFPDCKIDLFVRGGLSPILFENYPNIDRIIQLPKKPFKELLKYLKVWCALRKKKYNIAINVDGNSSSGRLSVQFARAKWRFFNNYDEELAARYSDYTHIAKFPVYNFRRFLTLLGYKVPEKEIPTLNLRLTDTEIVHGKKVLDNLVDPAKKTISIYTFATGAKCYSEAWWAEVYDRIKSEFFDKYNILEVLPVENVSQIGWKAPTYYSKDLREIGAVIANSALFFGADSGMMHLASASGAPTIGLFSVTKLTQYEPYGNGSVAIDTNTATIDEMMAQISKNTY
ncbi:ADP-heptose--LPS heptosyltransferase [Bacteroidia bacterium]|nr:ADP-heptose--LPS heptosyltransferase [Bacteroidia bacterium]